MKIIEKKCPNCHANLEFDVGEANVKCPNCRRAYAVEYDKDFVDPEVRLKAKDIQLKLLDSVDQSLKFRKVIVVVVIIATLVIIGFSIFFAIKINKDFEDSRQEFNKTRDRIMDDFENHFDQ